MPPPPPPPPQKIVEIGKVRNATYRNVFPVICGKMLTPKHLIFLTGKSTCTCTCILLHGKTLLMSQCDKISCISYTILNYVYTTDKGSLLDMP